MSFYDWIKICRRKHDVNLTNLAKYLPNKTNNTYRMKYKT